MHVLVVGCGWLGTEVARALVERGDRVTGVRRDTGRAPTLQSLGVEPLALDLAEPDAAARLPVDVEAIVACQAARGDSVDDYRRAYVEVNRTILRAMRDRSVRALVYTGSTGVFGQTDGSDVDETIPIAPASPTADVLAEAEALLMDAARGGIPARIVRLSGLYGPGRAGIVGRVRSRQLALGAGDGIWMNFCHLEDAVGFTLAALDRGRSGGVYHGSDAEPSRRRDVVRWIADRVGVTPAHRDGGSAPAGRGADRRIVSVRTRAELGYSLRFPTYREGLGPLIGAA